MSHLSKSVPGLAVYQRNIYIESYKIFEFEDGLDLEHHELHYNLVANFNLPFRGSIHGSANGLLFGRHLGFGPDGLYICNPITRDYIELHCPQEFVYSYPQEVTYGFGVSKMTGQLKVVRIFHKRILNQETHNVEKIAGAECQVYTLGTGSWRKLEPAAQLVYYCCTSGAFLNGNLHWLVFDLDGFPWISCFDLETELFSTISPPTLLGHGKLLVGMFVLEDCLCLCDYSSDKIVIWLMKEYGVEKSWTKEFFISKIPDVAAKAYAPVSPIKVFKDGDILMGCDNFSLFYYSHKTDTTQEVDMFREHICTDAIHYTPSFLSLKTFGVENVNSF